ncbi:MAG: DUF1841 family protein [Candidatus Thioglobus sp.]|nr:MAG: DUF1841 family protein [Candidatus Thioglobus sp.]
MLYTQNRTQQRQFLANAWQKFSDKKPLDVLEDQLVQVIKMHPEYHKFINDIEADYLPEQGEINPFLHINLHLSLREQLSINQPLGIQNYYQKILHKTKDAHSAEHKMMDCIAEMIFSAQKNNTQINHQSYIRCLEKFAC